MEFTNDIHYDKDALVVQANELIRSKQDELSLLEAKLVRLAISQIVMDDTDLRTYTCRITELAAFLGIPQDNIYRDIDDLTTSLMGKLIYIIDKTKPKKRNGQPNYHKFPWVDYCSYIDGVLTIRISDKLKPYLIGLDRLFTMYGYECILTLPTAPSIRLFDLLSSYESLANPYNPRNNTYTNLFPQIPRDRNELIFSVDYLREYFNCGDKYPNTSDFMKWVIDISVKGINRKSPSMKVSYRTAKEGRKIGYVLFKINAWTDKDFIDFIKPYLKDSF